MLIYHKKNGNINVIQVMQGFERDKISSSEVKNVNNLPKEHQEFVSKIKKAKDQIFVTGNTSSEGNGIFLDNLFVEYTKIESSHPKIFVPTNPDFKPGIEAVEYKFKKEWVDYANGLERDRKNALESGEGYVMSVEEIDYLADKKRTELFKERKIEKSKLKSYKEMGVIVEPTKVENYLSQKESETIIDKVKSKVVDEDNVETQIESSQEMKNIVQSEETKKMKNT